MHSDQLRAIRERRLDLDFRNHLTDAVHDIFPRQNAAAKAHDLGDALAFTGQFQQLSGDERDRFGMIEFEAAFSARTGELSGDEDQELIAFLRRQVHGEFTESVRGSRTGRILKNQ